jgi:hypothetical protein
MPSRPARLSAHETVFQDETVERTAPGLPPTPDLLAMLSPEHPGAGEPPQTEPTVEQVPGTRTQEVLRRRRRAKN